MRTALVLVCSAALGVPLLPGFAAHTDSGAHPLPFAGTGIPFPAGADLVAGWYVGSAVPVVALRGSTAPLPDPCAPEADLGTGCRVLLDFVVAQDVSLLCDMEVGSVASGDPSDPSVAADESFVDGSGTLGVRPDGLWNDGGFGGACHTNHYGNQQYNTPGCDYGSAFAEDAVAGSDIWIMTLCDSTITLDDGTIVCGAGDGADDMAMGAGGADGPGVPFAATHAGCGESTSIASILVMDAIVATFAPDGTVSVQSAVPATHGWVASGGGSAQAADPSCADGVDNDGDEVADDGDSDCHFDGDAANPSSYDPEGDWESPTIFCQSPYHYYLKGGDAPNAQKAQDKQGAFLLNPGQTSKSYAVDPKKCTFLELHNAGPGSPVRVVFYDGAGQPLKQGNGQNHDDLPAKKRTTIGIPKKAVSFTLENRDGAEQAGGAWYTKK